MMKALWKDVLRETRYTFARFLALFGIIFLGTGFFVGIRGASPDMKESAAQYFADTHLEDITVQSTYGLYDEDLAQLKTIKDIAVTPYRSVAYEAADKGLLVRFYPNFNAMGDINHFQVVSGRLPHAPDEVAIDAWLLKKGYSADIIGQKVRFPEPKNDSNDSKNSDQRKPKLKQHEFTVVGIVNSPMFIDGSQRGVTNIGKGTIDGYMVVMPEIIVGDMYTNFAIDVTSADHEKAYSDAYQSIIDNKLKEVQAALADRPDIVYQDLKREMQAKIDEGEAELKTNKDKLSKEEKQVKAAKLAWQKAYDEFSAQKGAFLTQIPVGLEPTHVPAYTPIALAEGRLHREKEKLDKAEATFNEEKAKADKKIADAEMDLSEAKDTLVNLKAPTYHIDDRSSLNGYSEYEDNAIRIRAIGNVFPLVFFLVAALVSFTTMTRMVKDSRIQIGTLKALGYHPKEIARKYLFYATSATLLGTLMGVVFGTYFFPWVIMTAYRMLYTLGASVYQFYVKDIFLALALAFLTTVGPAVLMTGSSLVESASSLMRPKPPKKGEHIFLEKWQWLWNKLSFKQKITLRNLFRYKGRNTMTIIGIAGCTGLMLTGFGINNSIAGLPDIQYDQLELRDGTVQFRPNIKAEEITKLEQAIARDDRVKDSLSTYTTTFETSDKNINVQSVNVLAVDPGRVNALFALRDMKTGKDQSFKADDVFISEKLAQLLHLKVGDKISLKNDDGETLSVKVTGIFENYIFHYLLIGKARFENEMGQTYLDNSTQFSMKQNDAKKLENLISNLIKNDKVAGAFDLALVRDSFDNTVRTLNLVVLVLIISAGALAFIVLYCLTNINVSERVRELSTLKVLGAFANEVTMYIFRETLIMTLIGILLGYGFGYILTGYILKTVEIDMMIFPLKISWTAYLYAGLLALGFTLIVMMIMHKKLKHVDMVEALKGVE